MKAKDERFDPEMLQQCFKPKKQLKVILQEAQAIEASLNDACYGDSPFGSKDNVVRLYREHLNRQRKAA